MVFLSSALSFAQRLISLPFESTSNPTSFILNETTTLSLSSMLNMMVSRFQKPLGIFFPTLTSLSTISPLLFSHLIITEPGIPEWELDTLIPRLLGRRVPTGGAQSPTLLV